MSDDDDDRGMFRREYLGRPVRPEPSPGPWTVKEHREYNPITARAETTWVVLDANSKFVAECERAVDARHIADAVGRAKAEDDAKKPESPNNGLTDLQVLQRNAIREQRWRDAGCPPVEIGENFDPPQDEKHVAGVMEVVGPGVLWKATTLDIYGESSTTVGQGFKVAIAAEDVRKLESIQAKARAWDAFRAAFRDQQDKPGLLPISRADQLGVEPTYPWAIGRRYVMHVDGMELWGTLIAVTDHELVLGQVVFWNRPCYRLPVGLTPGSKEPEPDHRGLVVSVPEMIVSRSANLAAALWEPRPANVESGAPYR